MNLLRSLQLNSHSCLAKRLVLIARTCAEFGKYLLQHLWFRIRAHLFPNKRAPKSPAASASAQRKRAVGARVVQDHLSPEQHMLWSNDPRIWRRWL